jgi:hypothetical protein
MIGMSISSIFMTEIMRQITSRKLERWQLASLPVGDKLRMLEEMVQATNAISAARPPKPKVALTRARLSGQSGSK